MLAAPAAAAGPWPHGHRPAGRAQPGAETPAHRAIMPPQRLPADFFHTVKLCRGRWFISVAQWTPASISVQSFDGATSKGYNSRWASFDFSHKEKFLVRREKAWS